MERFSGFMSIPSLLALRPILVMNGEGTKRMHAEIDTYDASVEFMIEAMLRNQVSTAQDLLTNDKYVFNMDSLQRVLAENDTLATRFLKAAFHTDRRDIISEALRMWGKAPQTTYLPALKGWWTQTSPWEACNLQREADGHVIVDLFHCRNKIGDGTGDNFQEDSFRDFETEASVFFAPSLKSMYDMIYDGSMAEYVQEDSYGEGEQLMYKRGRFRFKPLLWFEDADIGDLKKDQERFSLILNMLASNVQFENMDEEVQRLINLDQRSLRRRLWQLKDRPKAPFRLDNNSVEPRGFSKALSEGYGGALSIDVSGFGVLTGRGDISSESVVIWDVPGCLVEEDPWIACIL